MISTFPDGRLRLEETWEWEFRDGSGTGAVEEIEGGLTSHFVHRVDYRGGHADRDD